MQLGDILVTIDSSPTGHKRMQLALALAARCNARVTGYFLPAGEAYKTRDLRSQWLPPGDQDADASRVLSEKEETEAASLEFERSLRVNSIEGLWVLGNRSADVDELIAHSRCADLVVIGLGIPDDPRNDPQGIDIEKLVVACGRPVLGIPIIDVPVTIGQRILVAWDGSQACTRALHDSLPFLREATAVHLVSVNGDPLSTASVSNAAAHLGRLGIEADVDTSLSLHLPIGEEILSHIERNDIDLLVAGAFGHSRVWERFFGGASETLLHQMMTPILVSH